MRLRLVASAAIALVTLCGGYCFHEARADPIVRRAAIALPDWPMGAPPITVALVSDIHIGNAAMDATRLTRIVGQINAQHPDLVLLAGDYVAGRDPDAAIAPAKALAAPIAELRAPLGVVAVLGNHDQWTQPMLIARVLRQAGVTVLENQAVERGPVAIGGFGDVFSDHADLSATIAAMAKLPGARIGLTHSPDLSPRLHASIGLVVAGHTHCGQVVLPGWGPVVTRSPFIGRVLYDRRYRCGVIRDPDRVTIVTAGLGGEPARLGAPPDIWLVTVGPKRP